MIFPVLGFFAYYLRVNNVLNISYLDFGFVSYFDIRISHLILACPG